MEGPNERAEKQWALREKRLLILTFIRTRMVARKYLCQLASLRHDRRQIDRLAKRAEMVLGDNEF